MNQLQKREKAINDKAVTIGLQLVKLTSNLHKVKPYQLEPIPTREANQRWGTTYRASRYWLDDLEAEIDRLINEQPTN